MDFTVFYAWQSDTDQERNRYFIRDALKKAIKLLRAEAELAERPRIDHDTKGIPGTPDIFESILKKISECGIFVADVTLSGHSVGGEPIPNPNVMLETGFAMAKLGDRRVLLVMNEAFGKAERLPFDLAQRRWPLTYDLGPEVDPDLDHMQPLAERLRDSMRQVLTSGPVTNVDEGARRRLRAIIFDPRNETPDVKKLGPEIALFPDFVGQGVFLHLRNLAVPESVCRSEEERSFVRGMLSAYSAFRRDCGGIDTYVVEQARKISKPGVFNRTFHAASFYCVASAEKYPEDQILELVMLTTPLAKKDDLQLIATSLMSDGGFNSRLSDARKHRDEVRRLCGTLSGLFGE